MKPYPHSLPVPVACLTIFLTAASFTVSAETVTLTPVADTSLFSSTPENNLGGNLSMAVGTTTAEAPTRGLVRFDTTAAIPSDARIVSVGLQLQVVRAPFLAEPAIFDLHRLLVSWGEGSGGSGGGVGTGTLAINGEATWNSRFHGAEAWAEAGGAPGTDFTIAASGSTANTGTEPLSFESSVELIADVQTWVNTPTSNFGWLIKDRFEGVSGTARRLASREDATRAPALTVEFVRETPLSVNASLDDGGNICFAFTAKPGKTYKLQRRELVDSGDWTAIATRAPDETGGEATLCEPLSTAAPSRFYRVSEE